MTQGVHVLVTLVFVVRLTSFIVWHGINLMAKCTCTFHWHKNGRFNSTVHVAKQSEEQLMKAENRSMRRKGEIKQLQNICLPLNSCFLFLLIKMQYIRYKLQKHYESSILAH